MKIVFGPRRMNAGVQPLKRNLGPSFLRDVESTSMGLDLPDYGVVSKATYSNMLGILTADISLDRRTSAGEQTAGTVHQPASTRRKRMN